MQVLVFSPHFDDESIGCGGVLVKHAAEGCKVTVVFITDGRSRSPYFPDMSAESYGAMRLEEAKKALNVLNVHTFKCLEQPEGFVTHSSELERTIISLIRDYSPDIVYVPHEADDHPDHLVTCQVVNNSVNKASWEYFPDLGKPHFVNELRYFEVWTPLSRPNLYVDIEKEADIKHAAIDCYASQTLQTDYANAIHGLNTYRAIMKGNSSLCEAFRVEKFRQYL